MSDSLGVFIVKCIQDAIRKFYHGLIFIGYFHFAKAKFKF
jgi:hypothetical protein